MAFETMYYYHIYSISLQYNDSFITDLYSQNVIILLFDIII